MSLRESSLPCRVRLAWASPRTLLNLPAGLDRPDEGRVQYKGRNVADMSQAERLELRRRTFGFVFQAFHLMSHSCWPMNP